MRRRKLAVKGLMEKEELEDVESQGEDLDSHCFKWLLETTESQEHYMTALRAQAELDRQKWNPERRVSADALREDAYQSV